MNVRPGITKITVGKSKIACYQQQTHRQKFITLMEFLDGEIKISAGKQQNKAGKTFQLKLGGEQNFLGGWSFHLGGEAFQRGRYWGVYSLLKKS